MIYLKHVETKINSSLTFLRRPIMVAEPCWFCKTDPPDVPGDPTRFCGKCGAPLGEVLGIQDKEVGKTTIAKVRIPATTEFPEETWEVSFEDGVRKSLEQVA